MTPDPTSRLRPLADRFWEKVEKTDACWEWRGQRNLGGYGLIRPGGSRNHVGAHRVSYELSIGPIPAGFQIDHLCRNRGCVNPAHLEAVTGRENLLRGNTFQARNAAATHCPRGHEYTSENTRVYRGRRHCRACDRLRQQRD